MTALALIAACGTSPQPTAPRPAEAIRVEVLAPAYKRGTPAQLDLVNDSTLAASGRACAQALQLLVGVDAWYQIRTYDASCDAIQVTVEPGERKRVVASLPASLTPGTYRTVHELGMGVLRIAYLRYSQPFQVR